MRQARVVQPSPMSAFAPRERPFGLVVGGAELVDAAVECLVEGVGDICDESLLLRPVAVDGTLLEVDEIKDDNNTKPGIIAVVILPVSVVFKPKILNF